MNSTSKGSPMCPSDRQLALRAVINHGWSQRGERLNRAGSETQDQVNIGEEELRIIESVILADENLQNTVKTRDLGKKFVKTGEMHSSGGRRECAVPCPMCGQPYRTSSFRTRVDLCRECGKRHFPQCSRRFSQNLYQALRPATLPSAAKANRRPNWFERMDNLSPLSSDDDYEEIGFNTTKPRPAADAVAAAAGGGSSVEFSGRLKPNAWTNQVGEGHKEHGAQRNNYRRDERKYQNPQRHFHIPMDYARPVIRQLPKPQVAEVMTRARPIDNAVWDWLHRNPTANTNLRTTTDLDVLAPAPAIPPSPTLTFTESSSLEKETEPTIRPRGRRIFQPIVNFFTKKFANNN